MERPAKIICLRSGALGDCVVSTAALRLLRNHFPRAEITVIGDPYSAPILEGLDSYDRLLVLSHREMTKASYLKSLLELRREKPDILIDFNCSGRSRVQAILIGARRRLGYDRGRWLANAAYTELVPYPDGHALLRLVGLLEALGIEPAKEDLRVEVPIREEHREEARRMLSQAGVKGRFAILQATANSYRNRPAWPSKRFAAVAEHLYERGLKVVVTSATADEPAFVDVITSASCQIHNIAGKTSPLILAAVIAEASLYVGYNTGPMHLAAAAGVPIVALVDLPADESKWFPWTDAPYKLFNAGPSDEPASWHIENIEVDHVKTGIDEVLSHWMAVKG